MTTIYEADGRARQGEKDFGTATLLYILWDFTVSDLAPIGPRLGATEAKSSNALLAAYFSCNKINNKTKQAVRLGLPVLYVSHFRNITCNHMLESSKGTRRGKYDIFSLDSAQQMKASYRERRGLPLISTRRPTRTITHSFTNT